MFHISKLVLLSFVRRMYASVNLNLLTFFQFANLYENLHNVCIFRGPAPLTNKDTGQGMHLRRSHTVDKQRHRSRYASSEVPHRWQTKTQVKPKRFQIYFLSFSLFSLNLFIVCIPQSPSLCHQLFKVSSLLLVCEVCVCVASRAVLVKEHSWLNRGRFGLFRTRVQAHTFFGVENRRS